MNEELATLREQIERLAEENRRSARRERRIIRIGVAMIALMGVLLIAGGDSTGPRREVEASEIRLVDQNGKLRAKLGVSDGNVAVLLQDQDGKVRLGLAVSPTGVGGLALIDSGNIERLSLGIPGPGPTLVLRDTEGRECLGFGLKQDVVGLNVLRYSEHSTTDLFLGISRGSPRFTIGEMDAAQLRAFRDKGEAHEVRHALRLGVTDRGMPELALLDLDGKERLHASVTPARLAGIELRDGDQTPRLTLTTTARGEPRMLLQEKDRILIIPPPEGKVQPPRVKKTGEKLSRRGS